MSGEQTMGERSPNDREPAGTATERRPGRGSGVAVPVAPSETLEATVYHAAERADDSGGPLHLVTTRVGTGGGSSTNRRALKRAERAAESASEAAVDIRTATLATDRYLEDPPGHVAAIGDYVEENGIAELVIDPGYGVDATAPSLLPVRVALDSAGIPYTVAPVQDEGGWWRPTRDELTRAGAVFIAAFAFYVVLAGEATPFAVGTGAVTAVVAAAVLRNVAFESTPVSGPSIAAAARALPFVPYLLWEIAKANAQFALVVLRPSLPVDPHLDRIDAAVDSGLSVTVLANSLTLTPGTLTVDASGSRLLVHSLTAGSREDLLDGGRERAIRFVFYGRAATDLPTPRDRGAAESVVAPGSTRVGEATDDGSGSRPTGGADRE